jgi:hypothetical protein
MISHIIKCTPIIFINIQLGKRLKNWAWVGGLRPPTHDNGERSTSFLATLSGAGGACPT